jgi:hypothetical protein
MSRLFLHCEFCGRKQADGLLSRAAWGHFVLDDGRALCVCAGCKALNADWEERLRAVVVRPGTTFEGGAFSFPQRPSAS